MAILVSEAEDIQRRVDKLKTGLTGLQHLLFRPLGPSAESSATSDDTTTPASPDVLAAAKEILSGLLGDIEALQRRITPPAAASASAADSSGSSGSSLSSLSSSSSTFSPPSGPPAPVEPSPIPLPSRIPVPSGNPVASVACAPPVEATTPSDAPVEPSRIPPPSRIPVPSGNPVASVACAAPVDATTPSDAPVPPSRIPVASKKIPGASDAVTRVAPVVPGQAAEKESLEDEDSLDPQPTPENARAVASRPAPNEDSLLGRDDIPQPPPELGLRRAQKRKSVASRPAADDDDDSDDDDDDNDDDNDEAPGPSAGKTRAGAGKTTARRASKRARKARDSDLADAFVTEARLVKFVDGIAVLRQQLSGHDDADGSQTPSGLWAQRAAAYFRQSNTLLGKGRLFKLKGWLFAIEVHKIIEGQMADMGYARAVKEILDPIIVELGDSDSPAARQRLREWLKQPRRMDKVLGEQLLGLLPFLALDDGGWAWMNDRAPTAAKPLEEFRGLLAGDPRIQDMARVGKTVTECLENNRPLPRLPWEAESPASGDSTWSTVLGPDGPPQSVVAGPSSRLDSVSQLRDMDMSLVDSILASFAA